MSHRYEEYYSLYDEIYNAHISQDQRNVSKMLREKNIYLRSKVLITACIEDGYFNKEEGMKIDEILILVFEGVLNKVRMELLAPDKAFEKFTDYLLFIINKDSH